MLGCLLFMFIEGNFMIDGPKDSKYAIRLYSDTKAFHERPRKLEILYITS
jgi:hypothetical protein